MRSPDAAECTLCVVIPAYQPDERLVELVDQLHGIGQHPDSAATAGPSLPIVVVDDGSEACDEIFSRVEERGVPIIRFERNRGKGAALREGLRWAAHRGFSLAVTADSDGQHTRQAILDVARCAKENPGCLILGVRDIAQMPRRSRLGNTLARTLFGMLYNVHLTDTQTGLRGIPLEHIDQLAALRGDRYEYEMNMLVHAGTLFDGIREVPIPTVYFNDNSGSHFDAVKDGLRVCKALFGSMPKFLAVSLSSFAIDCSLFSAFYYGGGFAAVGATIAARAISATYNYLMNRHWAFSGSGEHYTFWRYVLLSSALLAVNSALMHLLVGILEGPALLMKIVVECLLYAVSFTVQNNMALGAHEDGKRR